MEEDFSSSRKKKCHFYYYHYYCFSIVYIFEKSTQHNKEGRKSKTKDDEERYMFLGRFVFVVVFFIYLYYFSTIFYLFEYIPERYLIIIFPLLFCFVQAKKKDLVFVMLLNF